MKLVGEVKLAGRWDERPYRVYRKGRHYCAECSEPMPPDCAKLAFCSEECRAHRILNDVVVG
jgi:hypothetical protein